MRACRTAVATALLGMAAGMSFDANSASLRVGITIVETCRADAVQADCRPDKPFSVALGGRPLQNDGRSRPAAVPDDGVRTVSTDPRRRIVTFTF